MEIQFINVRQIGPAQMQKLRACLPAGRLRELDALADPLPHLCAEALARQMLGEKQKKAPDAVVITRTEHGKPLTEGIYFSLSHSGEWAVCALSDCPIGVDLEYRRDTVPAHLQRRLGTGDPEEFFRRWTAMEARVKCLGSTVFHWQEFLEDPAGCATEEIQAPEGYAATVCLKTK